MVKQVTFTGIKMKGVVFSRVDKKIKVHITYSLKDENNNDWEQKIIRLTEEDMTPSQISKANNLLTAIEGKIKKVEEL